MNHTTPFRYVQPDLPCLTSDVRKKHEMEVSREHCFFIGMRVTADNVMRYRHSLILADDFETLLYGITEERNTILNQQLAVSRHDIELVYVRNLMMLDTSAIDSIGKGIFGAIHEAKFWRDDHRFTVIGKSESEQIWLMHEQAPDALSAIRLARLHNIQFATKGFKPLDVRCAHPATWEFDSLFSEVAGRFMKLMSEACATRYAH